MSSVTEVAFFEKNRVQSATTKIGVEFADLLTSHTHSS